MNTLSSKTAALTLIAAVAPVLAVAWPFGEVSAAADGPNEAIITVDITPADAEAPKPDLTHVDVFAEMENTPDSRFLLARVPLGAAIGNRLTIHTDDLQPGVNYVFFAEGVKV
jgi:hypothetical protein